MNAPLMGGTKDIFRILVPGKCCLVASRQDSIYATGSREHAVKIWCKTSELVGSCLYKTHSTFLKLDP